MAKMNCMSIYFGIGPLRRNRQSPMARGPTCRGCRPGLRVERAGTWRRAASPRRECMRIDAIKVGINPPRTSTSSSRCRSAASPSSTRWTRRPARWWSTASCTRPMRYPGNYGFVPAHPVGGRRSHRRAGRQHAADRAGRRHQRAADRRAQDGGRCRRRREDPGRADAEADQALRARRQLHRPAPHHAWSRCSTSSSTTRTWSPASG